MCNGIVKWFRNTYIVPDVQTLASKELEKAKRNLLLAQTAREYADSMCKYREAQIQRLTAYLNDTSEERV